MKQKISLRGKEDSRNYTIFRVEEKNIDYEQVQDQLQEPSGQAGKHIRQGQQHSSSTQEV